MNTVIAVETSDLVGSTKLQADHLASVMKVLTQHLSRMQKTHKTIYEFYRGDGFQIMYPNIKDALRLSLSTKLFLMFEPSKTVHVTQSLACSEAKLPITTLNNRMDEAFVLSGRQLDKMSKGELSIHHFNSEASKKLMVDFFNRNINAISAKQAEVLYWYIQDDFPEHKHIASRLNMTRQNVNAQLKRTNADLIKRFILLFEQNTTAGKL